MKGRKMDWEKELAKPIQNRDFDSSWMDGVTRRLGSQTRAIRPNSVLVASIIGLLVVFGALFLNKDIIEKSISSGPTDSHDIQKLPVSFRLDPNEISSVQVVGGLPGTNSSPLYLNTEDTGRTIIAQISQWINDAIPITVQTENGKQGYPMVINLIKNDGKAVRVEPAIDCIVGTNADGSGAKTCSAIANEVFIQADSTTIRAESPELSDWVSGGWKQAPSPEPTEINASKEDASIRAIGTDPDGRLLVRPLSTATVAPLGAPSCIGLETDLNWTGTYEAVWESNTTGKTSKVMTFPVGFDIIQPSETPVRMQTFAMGDTKIFAYVPRYTDCRAQEIYFFGLEKETAFPISIQLEPGHSLPNIGQLPQRPFEVTKDELILTGGFGAGQDFLDVYHFRYDSNEHSLILRKTEQTKINDSQQKTAVIQLDDSAYTIPIISEEFKRYSFAAKTLKGIVWSPAPDRSESKDSIYYPANPFAFYLSDPSVHNLTINESKKLYALPATDENKYTILQDLNGVGDFVIYHTYLTGKGMAQAFKSQAWAMKVTEPPTITEIESYHSAGGFTHYYGIIQQDGIYVSLSVIPGNADGSDDQEVIIYTLATGEKESIQKFKWTDKGLQFKYNGKDYIVPLKQV